MTGIDFRNRRRSRLIGGHKEVAELLIAKGAEVDAKDDWPGATGLHYAAENGHKEVAEVLIAKGADLNAKRGYPAGDTPLHSATRAGNKDIVELLIENGADVDAKNNDGKTPEDVGNERQKDSLIFIAIVIGIPMGIGAILAIPLTFFLRTVADRPRRFLRYFILFVVVFMIECACSWGTDSLSNNAHSVVCLDGAMGNYSWDMASGVVQLLYQRFFRKFTCPKDALLYVPSHPARELDKDLKAAGIPKHTAEGKIAFHALRTSFVTLTYEAGANHKEAQELAWHSTPTLTANTYGRARNEHLAKVAEIGLFRIMDRCILRFGQPRNIVRGPRGTNFPPPAPNLSLCPNDFSLKQNPRPQSVRPAYSLTGRTRNSC